MENDENQWVSQLRKCPITLSIHKPVWFLHWKNVYLFRQKAKTYTDFSILVGLLVKFFNNKLAGGG
jgi:hypothetical protein